MSILSQRPPFLFSLLLLFLFLSVNLPLASSNTVYNNENRTITTSFVLNDKDASINAGLLDDLRSLSRNFCTSNSILNSHCPLHVYLELSSALHCSPLSPSKVKTFKFVHSPLHHDSEEFELLRDTFEHYGYEECQPGGPEDGDVGRDFMWTLGHVQKTVLGEEFMKTLIASNGKYNTFFGTKQLGNKDNLLRSLSKLKKDKNYLPRTFLTSEIPSIQDLRGTWLLKIPDVELGGGIKIVNLGIESDQELVRRCNHNDDNISRTYIDSDGIQWGEKDTKMTCILQRYVAPPLLMRPYGGSELKKFSVGIYVHVGFSEGVMHLFVHDEMLVLFSSFGFNEDVDEEMDLLKHLTNGLLNQRLNPEYNELKHVWNGTTFRKELKRVHSINYNLEIKPRVYKIIKEVFESGESDNFNVNKGYDLRNSFGYFRVDFLFDQTFNPYLLEVEIVPSTGSIGGIDGMLKRRVMHDTIGILGGKSVEEKIWLNGLRNNEEIDYVKEEGRSGVGTGGFECLIPCWGEVEGGEGGGGDVEAVKQPVEVLSLDTVKSKCTSCSKSWLEFCVTPTSLFNLEFHGRCQSKGELCTHDMHELYDSTIVKDCEESAYFEYGSVAFSKMVVDSGVVYNGKEEEIRGMKDLCTRVFLKREGYVYANDVPELKRLLYFCNINESGVVYPNRYGEISTVDAANGKLEEFVKLNYPAVIRGGQSQALRNWNYISLLDEFREEHVNALIFDGADSGSEISSAGMTFAEFCEYSINGFEAENSPFANPVIYLLLTTRRLKNNVAMDPNPDAEKLLTLLNFLGFEDGVMGMGLKEAWSNIRMGAGYDYPVHIDCFENVLVQLAGTKRVRLWGPGSIEAWKPMLNHKHWPGTSEEERRGAELNGRLEDESFGEVLLEEGDTVFIPAMYFHSVHVDGGAGGEGWSVSANRYYYGGKEGGSEWLDIMEGKKEEEFKIYEEKINQKVC